MAINIKEYRASEEANRRMMDTTIWQACRILGYDPNTIESSGAVFHELYEMYYVWELQKQSEATIEIEVGEFFATNYPSLEGGFKADIDDLDAFLEELRGEYAYVGKPSYSKRHGWCVDVYENMEA